MKPASVRELRNEFRRVSKWLEAGETVQIRHARISYFAPLAANG